MPDQPKSGDHRYIEHCKLLIEKRLNWGKSDTWKQRDFENLSELILAESDVLLSLSTLKRVWKNGKNRTPHGSTLNALAAFLGYVNWLDFKSKQREKLPEDTGQQLNQGQSDAAPAGNSKKRRTRRAYWPAIWATASLALVLLFAYSYRSLAKIDESEITFRSKKVVANGVPNSVIFDYDVQSVASNSVYIQQSWNEKERMLLRKDKSHQTCIYYYPGYHRAKLIVDGQAVKQQNIHITTDGWLGLVRHNFDDTIPIYLPREKIVNGERLYITPGTLRDHGVKVDERKYLLSYFNVQDFGDVSGDDFAYEATLKNAFEDGGLICQYAYVIVLCETGRMVIPLSIPGCVSQLNLRLIDAVFPGSENDLSAFGADLSTWNTVRIQSKNKLVTLAINGAEIFSATYEKPAGRVVGLHFQFFGSGSVREAKLYDGQGNLVFENVGKFD